MNAKFFLSVAAIACCAITYAQPGPKLRAASHWQLTNAQQYLPYDSIVYKHSGNRNTIAPMTTVGWFTGDGYDRYDTAIWYKFDQTIPLWVYNWRLLRNYDAGDSVTEYYEQQMNIPTQTWNNVDRTKWVYDTNHKADTSWQQTYDQVNSVFVDNFRNAYAYQGGKLVCRFAQQWQAIPSTWRNADYDSFYYNQNGLDSIWILGMWSMPGNVFNENYRKISQWDVNGRKIRDTLYANFVLNSYTEYLYDANGKLLRDSSYQWIVNQQAFIPANKNLYTYDNNGNLIKKQTWNWSTSAQVYYEAVRIYYAYNGYNQLVKYNSDNFYNNVWKKNGMDRFYYYDSTTSVADVSADKILNVYPVPAVAYITVDLNFAAPQAFTAIITDMQGRIVKQWTEPACKQYKKQVYLSGMPAGNYTLQVRTGKDALTRKFNIIQ